MEKQLLHSVLQTIIPNTKITITFISPHDILNGEYTVISSKTGRGRGGSRLLELKNINNTILNGLIIEGITKPLGTPCSECIKSITVEGIEYNSNHEIVKNSEINSAQEVMTTLSQKDVPETKRLKKDPNLKPAVIAAKKLANIVGNILVKKPSTAFKIIGQKNLRDVTGEWKVKEFKFENDRLQMELIGYENADFSFSFDSDAHGHLIRDVSIIELI